MTKAELIRNEIIEASKAISEAAISKLDYLYLGEGAITLVDDFSNTYEFLYQGETYTGVSLTGEKYFVGDIVYALFSNANDIKKMIIGKRNRYASWSPTDEIPVIEGLDGETSYVHIAYADYATGDGISLNPVGKSYMGIYVDFTKEVSLDPLKYEWVLTKGPKGEAGEVGPRGLQGQQGPEGKQGIQGSKGADGLSSYTHIAYATGAQGQNFNHDTFPEATYIGMYVSPDEDSSGGWNDYEWTLVKGKDGSQGLRGPEGKNGLTPYFHTAWANSADGVAGFDTTVSVNKLYIGTATTFESDDPTEPSAYNWTKIKGDKGDQGDQGPKGATGAAGISITKVDVEYAQSTSATTAPTTGWRTNAPTWKDNQYIWSRTVTTYSSGDPTYSKPAAITGQKGSTGSPGSPGSPGATGTGVSSISEEYAISTSKTSTPASSSFSATRPNWTTGQYIWTRSKIVYKNPTSTSYTEPVVSSEWEAATQAEANAKAEALRLSNEALSSAKSDATAKANEAQRLAKIASDASAAAAERAAIAEADRVITAKEAALIETANADRAAAIAKADKAASDAQIAAQAYSDLQDIEVQRLAALDAKNKADAALASAKTDATTKANAAKEAADLVSAAVAAQAQANAEAHADGIVTAEEERAMKEASDNLLVAQAAAAKAKTDAEAAAKAYADAQDLILKKQAASDAQTKANKALSDAKLDATTKTDAAKAASDIYTNLQSEELKKYVASRGENLVTNGTGLLNNNTNFTSLDFDGSDNYGANGSFTTSQFNTTKLTNETMPVNPELRYVMSYFVKENPNVQSRHYGMVVCVDVDGRNIGSEHTMYIPKTLTTLAREVKNGDTEVFLTSAANWKNNVGTSTHMRKFIFWNYTNDSGYSFPELTYSRNVTLGNSWSDGDVDFSLNKISLRVPWNYGTYAKGTKVSNGSAGSGYKYIAGSNFIGPEDWENKTGVISGIDYTGSNNNNKFHPGTASVKMGWLLNRNNPNGKVWLSNISFNIDYEGQIEDAKIDAQTKANEARLAAEKYAREQDATNLTAAKNDAQTKANEAQRLAKLASEADASAAEIRAKAHADGKITDEEAERIRVADLDRIAAADKASAAQAAAIAAAKVHADAEDAKIQAELDKTVKSTTVEYYLSTSLTALAGGSWSVTAPKWVDGKYMWSRTKVILNDGTPSYTPSANGTCIAGAKGADGVSPIVGLLTNESITLPASDKGAVSSFTGATGTFEIYDGTTRKTGSGVTYSVSGTPSNIGVSIDAKTGVYAVSTMTTGASVLSGTATLRAVYGGVTIDKVLTVTKALAGTKGTPGATGGTGATGSSGKDATTYWINASTNAIKKDAKGTIVPGTITFSGFGKTGTANPVAYAGRFIIQTSTNGVSYTNAYTSTVNQASYTYTIPTTASFVKARYYLAGGTSILLDEQTIPVLVDAEGIEIGGRNLLLGTSVDPTEVSLLATEFYGQFGTTTELEAGKTYTFSIIVDKVSTDTVIPAIALGLGNTPNSYNYDFPGSWAQKQIINGVKLSMTYTVTSSDVAGGRVYFAWRIRNEKIPTVVQYRELKLEKGNVATDWTSAPEDLEAVIRAERELAEINFKAYADGIITAEEERAIADAEAKLNEAKKYVDDLDVGGRNFVLSSATLHEFNETHPTSTTHYDKVERLGHDLAVGGRNLVLDSTNGGAGWNSTVYNVIPRGQLSEDWVVGETYTVSIKGSVNSPNSFGIWRDTGSTGLGSLMSHSPSTGVYTQTYINIANTSQSVKNMFSIYNVVSGSASQAEIEWIKIEKGDIATQWSPAPEDFNNLKGARYNLSQPLQRDQYYTLSVDSLLGDWAGVWLGDDVHLGHLKDNKLTFKLTEASSEDYIIVKSLNEYGGIEKIKLERGNTPTDWSPAPEDVSQEIADAADSARDAVMDVITTNYVTTAVLNNSISNEVIARTEMGDKLVDEIASQVKQSAASFDVIFNKIEEDRDLTNVEVALIQSYFRINENGVVIGKSNSPIEFFAENNRVGFRESGSDKPFAYWEEGTMHVDKLIAITTIMVGYHLIEKYDSPVAGKTTIVRIGD